MSPFDISATVLCDEVRQENNGKHILIGVYLHTVLVEDFPANLTLSVWTEIKPKKVGKFTGKIRVIKDDESVLLRGETQIIVESLDPTSARYSRLPLEFQQGGDYFFQWKWGDNEWETVKEFTVQKQSAPRKEVAK